MPLPEFEGMGTLSYKIHSVVNKFNISSCSNPQVCLCLLEEPLAGNQYQTLKFGLDPLLKLTKTLNFPTIIIYTLNLKRAQKSSMGGRSCGRLGGLLDLGI